MNPADVTLWLAFAAGFLSFVSPCMLPLYPSYLSYITGVSVQEMREGNASVWKQRKSAIHTLFFMLGFSVIFFALGLSASLIGRLFIQYQSSVQAVGGAVIVVMGLFMTGFFRDTWLMRERRFQLRSKPLGYLGSALMGIVFAAGWTPCIGPILTAVLLLSAAHPLQGIYLTVFYILGFSLPFFLLSFFLGKLKWWQKRAELLMRIGGLLMVLVGFLLMTDQMTRITIWLIQLFGGFTGF